jgi:Mn-dependent DtxR family transcriptional regulator
MKAMRTTRNEQAILTVYQALARRSGAWIRLADLRARLSGDHDEITATLIKMTRTGYVHLAPDSNRRGLTDADHDAAIRIGREDKHLLAIEFED